MSLRGFIERWRPRRWVPPQGNGLEHDDWRSGDLAVCISDATWVQIENGKPMPFHPRHGEIYRVAATWMLSGFHMLILYEMPGASFNAVAFRKIRPHQREACTEEFAEKMKRLRPKVGA